MSLIWPPRAITDTGWYTFSYFSVFFFHEWTKCAVWTISSPAKQNKVKVILQRGTFYAQFIYNWRYFCATGICTVFHKIWIPLLFWLSLFQIWTDFNKNCVVVFDRKYPSCHKILVCLFVKYFKPRQRCISYDRFCQSIQPSDRPSQLGIVTKQLQLRLCVLHWTIAPWL